MSRESFAKKRNRASHIIETLKQNYPTLTTFLTHSSTFQLLIAVILSAQCTDERVNLTTPALFEAYPTAETLAKAPIEHVMTLIKSINYYKTKSINIIETSHIIMTEFNGRVPQTLNSLITLPGVGRKTANVILGQAFNIPGITVDTHIKRLTKRLGFTRNQDATAIEFDLQKAWPEEHWIDLSTYLIFHGRQTCKPKHPNCDSCMIQSQCPQRFV